MAVIDARLIFSKGQPKLIGDVLIDVFSRENHNQNSIVTKYPIEDGSEISDHVINQPFSITINGLIGASTLTGSTGTINRVLDGYNQLTELRKNRQPVIVITGLKVYENMIITGLVVNRTSKDGGSLVFTINLEEIFIVNSQSILIPNTQLAGSTDTQLQSQGEQDLGKVSSGQTQQNEEDNFLVQIKADINSIFAAFE